jgi:signal transduction histidine kinase
MANQINLRIDDLAGDKHIAEIVAALHTIEDLKGLTEEEFAWLAMNGKEKLVEDGELIFSRVKPPRHMMFILSGEVLIHRHSSSPVSVLVGQAGRITGTTPFSRIAAWNADGRSSGRTWILELHDDDFPELLNAIPSMTQRIVRVLLDRNREYTRAEDQIGKLAALNKLAANLAHELNNPASAARSAGSHLLSASESGQEQIRYRIGMTLGGDDRLQAYLDWLSGLRSAISKSRQTAIENATAQSPSLEDSLMLWLESKGFAEAWKLAPTLAEFGIPLSTLQELERRMPADLLCVAISDVELTVNSYAAALSIADATQKIFRLVTAVKNYSYMDRQPIQDVNIAESLDNTLALFHPRLAGITVNRSYDADAPMLKAYGSELNQVWAAIVENSLDAMAGFGTLSLSTKLQGATILVEIADTGPGIPAEYSDRVFEPFFTTKPFGTGLGLGLDTVQRVIQKHCGTVTFTSRSDETTFHVRLPLDRTDVC